MTPYAHLEHYSTKVSNMAYSIPKVKEVQPKVQVLSDLLKRTHSRPTNLIGGHKVQEFKLNKHKSDAHAKVT